MFQRGWQPCSCPNVNPNPNPSLNLTFTRTLTLILPTLTLSIVTRSAMLQGLKKYDRDVAVALLTAMYEDDADFTNTFRALSGVSTSGDDDLPTSLAKVRPL